MEHRIAARVAARITVHVRASAHIDTVGSIHNVSMSGAFVQSKLRLAPNSRLKVYFDGRYGHAALMFALDAQVVRRSSEGLGLKWERHDSEILRSLLSILEDAR